MHAIQSMIQEHINTIGWSVIHVGADPAWTYTIGLTALKNNVPVPEILVFGLSGKTAQTLLNMIGDKIKNTGEVPQDGTVWDDLANFPVTFKAVPAAVLPDYVGQGLARFPQQSVLQMVITDEQGHFPWEEHYSTWMKQVQKELWHTGAHSITLH